MSAAARRVPIRLTPLRRHLAAIITIALSCAFVAVMVLAGNLVQASMRSSAAQQYAGADLVVDAPLSEDAWASEKPVDPPAVQGADAVWPLSQSYVQLDSTDAPNGPYLQVALPSPGQAEDLEAGSPASSADEVVLDRTAADALHVEVGGTVTLPAEFTTDGTARELTVSGIAPAPEGAAFGATARVIADDANSELLLGPTRGTLTESWLGPVRYGTDAAAVAEAASTSGTTVRTADEAEQETVDQMMQGFAALGLILGVFVVIALFTSAVVIANTFTVTVAQRTRSLALLRTLGATRGRVGRIVLRESVLVGLVGAVIGVVGGHLLVQAALAGAAAAGLLDAVVTVPVSVLSVVVPLVAGLVITVLAGLAPVRSATRVAPLQALRAVAAPPQGGFGVRGILGTVGAGVGLALMVGGALLASSQAVLGILVAVLGGLLSFGGLLLALTALTRPLALLLGRVAGRVGGLPARIAAANIARSPGRSAATVAALLIGTTLMTMMAVGARTTEATLTSELDSNRPIDLVVSASAMPEDAAAQIGAVDGIRVADAGTAGSIDVGGGEPLRVTALEPAVVKDVSHRPGMADELTDDTLLIGWERAGEMGLSDGQTVEVPDADGGTTTLTVRFDANLKMPLLTPATLASIAGKDTTPVVVADFEDKGSAARGDVDAYGIADAVMQVTAQDSFTDAEVTAGGAEREMYGQILQVLLGITVGLLAVAVLVALVGVANTLSLGVVERRGENALLRALGTTRSQMRAMLGWEGVLLAVIGAALGIVLGTIYGALGIIALLGSAVPVTVTIPWGQVGLVVAAAVLAGLLASVLPGRSAARTAPAAALAAAD